MEAQIKKLLKKLRLSESLLSTLLGLVVVLVAGALLYNYFSKKPTTNIDNLDLGETEKQEVESVKPGELQVGEKPSGLPTTHKIVKGETLWKISETYYGSGYNFMDIAGENRLTNANVIEVGIELTIPDVPSKKLTISTAQKPAIVSGQIIAGETYAVQGNDNLWSIAVRAYGDGYQWPKLYQANKGSIGNNPSRIEKGLKLTIPRN